MCTSPISVEQYRRLAATLYGLHVNAGLRTIMVSSALPRDGKTLTATNLALTLSESYSKRVLLIDADLRRPSIHEVFCLENRSGLAEGLQAGATGSLVVTEVSPTLTVLTAGTPDARPMAGLTSERMATILKEAASRFDWVLLDTPPIGLISDAQLLAGLVDGVLLVVGAGLTDYVAVSKTVKALGRERILGQVTGVARSNHAAAGAAGAARSAREQEGVALSAAAAERDCRPALAAAGELERGVQGEPRAGGADRVAEGDRAAVDVDDLGRGRDHGRTERDRGERLVDLDEVEVGALPAGLPGRRDRVGRLGVQRVVRAGDGPDAPTSASQGSPRASAHSRLARRARGAVAERRGIAGRDRAVLVEGRTERAERLDRGVRAHALVARHDAGSPLRCGTRRGRSRRRRGRLPAAAPPAGASGATSSCSARSMPERPLYRSVEMPIESPSKASVRPSKAAWSSTRRCRRPCRRGSRQQVRRVRHRLLSAGDDDGCLAERGSGGRRR